MEAPRPPLPPFDAEMAEAFLAGPPRHTDTLTAGKALVAGDPRPDLDRVSCPCLCLWGAQDNWVPLQDGMEYARPMHDEAPNPWLIERHERGNLLQSLQKRRVVRQPELRVTVVERQRREVAPSQAHDWLPICVYFSPDSRIN